MTYFFVISIVVICISLGFMLGSSWSYTGYKNQDWRILKWDSGSLGYRVMPKNRKVMRGDNVYLALKVDTSQIENDGFNINE